MFKMNLRSRVFDEGQNALSNEPDIVEIQLCGRGKMASVSSGTSTSESAPNFDLILLGCDGIWDGTTLGEPQQA